MSRDIWVISDTHFLHANSLKWENNGCVPNRGSLFNSVEEMNETMIDNWNSVVKDGDIIYHLGDVFMGGPEKDFKILWDRLKGRKRLILGNHDNVKVMVHGKYFQKIMLWRQFTEFNAVLSHIPIDKSGFKFRRSSDKETLNIHGHIHCQPSPTESHRCVCVEQINYTPILLEEITKK